MGLACAGPDPGGRRAFLPFHSIFPGALLFYLDEGLSVRIQGEKRRGDAVPGADSRAGGVHRHGEHRGGCGGYHRGRAGGIVLDVGFLPAGDDDRVCGEPAGGKAPGRAGRAWLHRKGGKVWKKAGCAVRGGLFPLLPGNGQYGPDQRGRRGIFRVWRSGVRQRGSDFCADAVCGQRRPALCGENYGKAGARHDSALFCGLSGSAVGVSG